jgi:hypothetical protein
MGLEFQIMCATLPVVFAQRNLQSCFCVTESIGLKASVPRYLLFFGAEMAPLLGLHVGVLGFGHVTWDGLRGV